MASSTAYGLGSISQHSPKRSWPAPDVLAEPVRDKFKELTKAEKERRALNAELDHFYKTQLKAISGQLGKLKSTPVCPSTGISALEEPYERQYELSESQARKLREIFQLGDHLQTLYLELYFLKADHSQRIKNKENFLSTEEQIKQKCNEITKTATAKTWAHIRLMDFSNRFITVQDAIVVIFNGAIERGVQQYVLDNFMGYIKEFEKVQDQIVDKYNRILDNGTRVRNLHLEFLAAVDDVLYKGHNVEVDSVVAKLEAPPDRKSRVLATPRQGLKVNSPQQLKVTPSWGSLRAASPSLRRTPSLRRIPSGISTARSVTPEPTPASPTDSTSGDDGSDSESGHGSDTTAPTDPDIDADDFPVVVTPAAVKVSKLDLKSLDVDEDQRLRWKMKRFQSTPDLRRANDEDEDEDTACIKAEFTKASTRFAPKSHTTKVPETVEEGGFDMEAGPPVDSDEED